MLLVTERALSADSLLPILKNALEIFVHSSPLFSLTELLLLGLWINALIHLKPL